MVQSSAKWHDSKSACFSDRERCWQVLATRSLRATWSLRATRSLRLFYSHQYLMMILHSLQLAPPSQFTAVPKPPPQSMVLFPHTPPPPVHCCSFILMPNYSSSHARDERQVWANQCPHMSEMPPPGHAAPVQQVAPRHKTLLMCPTQRAHLTRLSKTASWPIDLNLLEGD